MLIMTSLTRARVIQKAKVPPTSFYYCFFFFLVLLHYRLATLVGADFTTPFNTEFCMNSPQVTVCPAPPTFDLVNLHAFAGRWYEIGSNARFKLYRENGLACNSANYTVTSTAPNFWGFTQSNFSIVDSGVKAIGQVGEYGVMQISTASKGICQNARQMCTLLTSDSQLGQALTQLAATSSKLLLLHPAEAAQLITASANIGAAINSINADLDGLSQNVTRIQFLDAQLSQANGSVQDNLKKLNNVTLQTGFVQDTIQQAVKSIASARGVVIEVTAKLLFARGADLPITSVPDLGKVVFLLGAAELSIMTQASEIELALFGINAMMPLIALDSTKPGGVVSLSGTAVQNSTSMGRLTATINGVQAPFLILGVDGWANAGYNAALIYSCVPVPNGRYNQGLFVISRTPTLDQNVVERLLDIARFNGIQTTCDDPFLYTLQESPICPAQTSA